MSNWYSNSAENIFEKLKTNQHGLFGDEISRRFKEYGPNSLPEEKPDSIFKIFVSQFKSPLIYILFISSLVVISLGDLGDGLIILGVLIFNSIIGTIQEGRAQNTLLALKKFSETTATVLRDGKEIIISDKELVPGDLIILQEGEKIPADARIIISHGLKIDEAAMTGESVPVYKNEEDINRKDLPVHSQKNMVFKGTHIVGGNGKAVVVDTGINTVIGKIAKQISSIDTDIPLKKDVKKLSNSIILIVGVVSALIFIFGILKGFAVKEIFKIVVSLSVSVIPEGLPIVITLVLATGVWRMSKKNVLVKKLQAVEALGQATVIAVDKTGTITKNELILSKIWTDKKLFEITGEGYESKGDISIDNQIISALNHPEILSIAKILTLSSGARISFNEEQKTWKISGDPTEAAMLVFGEKVGFNRDDLLKEIPLISEIPFDFKLKYHALLNKVEENNILSVTGAPEVILDMCTTLKRDGRNVSLNEEYRDDLHKVFVKMSEEGLRVLAVATKDHGPNVLNAGSVHSLTFVGFIGMKDTIRPEVFESMKRAKQAGIKVVMITGDHKITAQAIAKEAGIFSDGDDIISGHELASMSQEEMLARLEKTSVFTRITPEDKSKIIEAYKLKGDIIAMTGDGVNDAPSLVTADLGVAMGKIGTEVAKEASDIVLMDDNFGSIISAIEEGRSIYKTIKRVILYLFSTGAGEMLTIIVALFVLDYPLPILAAQIIWLNLVTDGFLDVALSMEPKRKDLLSGRFKKYKKNLVDRLMMTRIIVMSIPMMIGTLYFFGQYFENNIEKAWTISLTTLAMFQWFNAWNCRSETKSIFALNPFSNLYLIGATIIVILLQILAVYNPFMQSILKTVPLTLDEWLMMIPVALSVVFVEEIRKVVHKFGILKWAYKY
ncbi:MAG: HAD-IC family P-type ATPase [Candidatus Paceibacterota bacterium]